MSTLLNSIDSRVPGPPLIALGLLGVLLAVGGNPAVALTAVALIALGAGVSLTQLTAPDRRVGYLTLHACVYATLYATYVGARLHSDGISPGVRADLAVSLIVLAVHAVLTHRACQCR